MGWRKSIGGGRDFDRYIKVCGWRHSHVYIIISKSMSAFGWRHRLRYVHNLKKSMGGGKQWRHLAINLHSLFLALKQNKNCINFRW